MKNLHHKINEKGYIFYHKWYRVCPDNLDTEIYRSVSEIVRVTKIENIVVIFINFNKEEMRFDF